MDRRRWTREWLGARGRPVPPQPVVVAWKRHPDNFALERRGLGLFAWMQRQAPPGEEGPRQHRGRAGRAAVLVKAPAAALLLLQQIRRILSNCGDLGRSPVAACIALLCSLKASYDFFTNIKTYVVGEFRRKASKEVLKKILEDNKGGLSDLNPDPSSCCKDANATDAFSFYDYLDWGKDDGRASATSMVMGLVLPNIGRFCKFTFGGDTGLPTCSDQLSRLVAAFLVAGKTMSGERKVIANLAAENNGI